MSSKPITIHEVKLIEKRQIATETMAFSFKKPPGFSYKAGQFADYTFENPPETDDEGNTRGFSLASAPYEDNLMLVTRMRDTAFKRVLGNMALGTEIKMDAPYGSFTLHNDNRIPAVFITGGIGITPVRSIVLQAAHDGDPHKLVVFYANKTPEDAAFLDELTEAQKSNPNYKLITTMTRTDKTGEDWHGETGHVTKAMLQKHIDDLNLPIYYVSGPPTMVAEIRKTLSESGIKDDNIRSEKFTGY